MRNLKKPSVFMIDVIEIILLKIIIIYLLMRVVLKRMENINILESLKIDIQILQLLI